MVARNFPKVKNFAGTISNTHRQLTRREKYQEAEKQLTKERERKRWEKQAEVRAKKRAKPKKSIKNFPGIPHVNFKSIPTLMWRP